MKNLIEKLRSLVFASSLIVLCSSSCFNSDPPKSCDFEQELDSYLNSLTAFSNNPTPATCENLKTTAFRLIDRYSDCEDFRLYKDDLRSSWASIDCSDF